MHKGGPDATTESEGAMSGEYGEWDKTSQLSVSK